MKAFARYAGVSAVIVAAAAALLSAVVSPGGEAGVWLAAAIAWVVQLVAFAVLLQARRPGFNFMIAWAGGVALRFVAVIVTAFWVTSATQLPAATALLSLVAFVFLLALLEPLFLRKAV